MKFSRNIKQNGLTGIIAMVSIIVNVLLFSSLEYADTIEVGTQDIVSMLDATGKDIVPVEFQQDTLITHSVKLHLMGELNLDAVLDDVLIFRKDNGIWIEVGRYLTEGIQ